MTAESTGSLHVKGMASSHIIHRYSLPDFLASADRCHFCIEKITSKSMDGVEWKILLSCHAADQQILEVKYDKIFAHKTCLMPPNVFVSTRTIVRHDGRVTHTLSCLHSSCMHPSPERLLAAKKSFCNNVHTIHTSTERLNAYYSYDD